MQGNLIWDSIISKLAYSELQTASGLWFMCYIEKGKLYAVGSDKHSPSSSISSPRLITYNEFHIVYSYFERWSNGETGIRREICNSSRNSAYILALIECYK